ncbi:MAG: trypsin-like peptidase domain-containing protein [Christensenellaceae bacterium]|jgi:serine protease Do|nr:trypsin-like peptidase domain-containing protein [Christensenellaceae bacterium]
MSMYDHNDYRDEEYRRPRRPQGPNPWAVISVALVLLILGGMLTAVLLNTGTASGFGLRPQNTPETTPYQEGEPATTATPRAQRPAAASSLPEFSSYIADLVDDVADSVVGISNYTQARYFDGETEFVQGSGSGVIISSDGYIVTNYHVVAGAVRVTVLINENEELDAKLVGYDSVMDIALLKIEKTGLTAAPLGDSDAVRTGEFVLTIGSPLGHELAGTVTFGTVSAASRQIAVEEGYSVSMIQTDAAINPGNSGGALLNMNGEVIGINTRKNSGITSSGAVIEGLGFAIPINEAKPLIDELMSTGTVKRPALGISGSLNPYRSQNGTIVYGMEVTDFSEGSKAPEAGMEVGDIIVSVDGQEITSSRNSLLHILYSKKPGDIVEVVVQRGSEKVTLKVELTETAVG